MSEPGQRRVAHHIAGALHLFQIRLPQPVEIKVVVAEVEALI